MIHSWKTCKLGGCDDCCSNPDCGNHCEECSIEHMLNHDEGRSVLVQQLAEAMLEPIRLSLWKRAMNIIA